MTCARQRRQPHPERAQVSGSPAKVGEGEGKGDGLCGDVGFDGEAKPQPPGCVTALSREPVPGAAATRLPGRPRCEEFSRLFFPKPPP